VRLPACCQFLLEYASAQAPVASMQYAHCGQTMAHVQMLYTQPQKSRRIRWLCKSRPRQLCMFHLRHPKRVPHWALCDHRTAQEAYRSWRHKEAGFSKLRLSKQCPGMGFQRHSRCSLCASSPCLVLTNAITASSCDLGSLHGRCHALDRGQSFFCACCVFTSAECCC
jgi:hypothetical protein